MNEEIKGPFENVNSNKIRKQLTSATQNITQMSNEEENCSNFHQSCDCTDNVDPICSTLCININRTEMNNLNNHNFSNGYHTKCKENISNRNGQNDNELYRKIFNSSSSDDDDDDEHCVYTYKGVEEASDFTDSFFNLSMNVPNGHEGASVCSSPEMDFLEMDFDPGPSNGQDSDSDNASLVQNVSSNEHINELCSESDETAISQVADFKHESVPKCDENANCYIKNSSLNVETVFKDSDSVINSSTSQNEIDHEQPCCSKSLNVNVYQVGMRSEFSVQPTNTFNEDSYSKDNSDDEQLYENNSKSAINFDVRKLFEDYDKEEITFISDGCSNEFRESPDENLEGNSFDISLVDFNLESNLIYYEDLLAVDPSCSISAIINVLKLLRISQFGSTERERLECVLRRKQIPENVSLVEYLYLRAVENANEMDIEKFSPNIFENKLYSRFFPTHSEIKFNLLKWLNMWMKKGAVPVVTRNIQERGSITTTSIIRNPWRHNVIYKIESSYVHLTNPLEKITECILHSQLTQAPLIYVKRKSILRRWNSKVDLRALMRANHNRWYNENVLGQVATIIREHYYGLKLTQYIRIPSNCNCGITLFVPTENLELCKEVKEAPELSAGIAKLPSFV